MSKLIVLCLALILPHITHAKLYKVVDAQGNTTYTDIAPTIDAKQHQLGKINSVRNPNFNRQKLYMTIPYQQKNGSMVVLGEINGIAMHFVVDTGATLLVIPPAIAKKAGLFDEPQTTITVQTANGAVSVPKVNIDNVTIQKTTQTNIAAVIQSVSTTEPHLGLLGMSFFNQYKMTIDQNKQEILLEPK